MTPIKQNAGVVFVMLSGFAYTILLCIGFMVLAKKQGLQPDCRN